MAASSLARDRSGGERGNVVEKAMVAFECLPAFPRCF